ncbi:YdcF family protein [Chlorobium sp. N1]|uniref:YdcF family protein n=1 Tax=Chlorobium sp. N1 TaxID=2491138 RepID=UPI00103A9907|nr:YdcF family protein [Chlorobium sp. N1]TCD48337.1 YdcF family protein [Chlorobium sp. N1]
MLRLLRTTLIILLAIAMLAGAGFLSLGYLLSFPAKKAEKADVIVILGGDSGRRVRKGAELYRSGYAPNVVLTGIDERYYRPGRLNWRQRRMVSLGVPLKAIKIDSRSQTTWDEAFNTMEAMKKHGWKKALIVSDPPHMFRLHTTWNRAFRKSGRSFVLIATRPEWWHPALWWNNAISSRFVYSELKKNLFYAIVYY